MTPKKPGKPRTVDVEGKKVRHRPPAPSKGPPGHSALKERLIQLEGGDVAKSKLKQLRHRTVGPAKRFWSGKNVLKSKWGNRAALLSALAATGLGIKAYMDANRSQPIVPTQGIPLDPYMMKGAAGYVQDIAATPRPTPQPKVTAPTTKPPSALAASARKPGDMGVPSTSPEGISGGEPKEASETAFPVMAGAAGGIGGYALADKFLEPYLKQREATLLSEIAKKQRSLGQLRKIQRYAPWGAAAAGAILLAALAAKKARDSEAARMQPRQLVPYDPSAAGFMPEQQIPLGAPEGFY